MEENYSQEIYDTFLSPLDSVNDTSSFRWHSHPTEMDCWCLSKHLNEPLILGSGCQLHQYPVILEITGQIFPQDCHLTLQTYKEMPTLEGSDMVRVAGCWIEPRGGMAAKTQWRRYEEAIYRLARTIEHPDVQLDRICWIGRDGLIKIQLICEVNDDVVSSFFFAGYSKLIPARNMQSRLEMVMAVSFGSTLTTTSLLMYVPVRALFMLHSYVDDEVDPPVPYISASLMHLQPI